MEIFSGLETRLSGNCKNSVNLRGIVRDRRTPELSDAGAHKPRTKGQWGFAQFAPFMTVEELKLILQKMQRKGWVEEINKKPSWRSRRN